MQEETPVWRRPFLAGDGIRGYGMLAVFVAHVVFAEPNYRLAGWTGMPGRDPASTFGADTGQYAVLSIGHTGLDLFLALSAYLLGRPFLAWALGERRPGLGRYAVRRSLRILPTFWTVCLLLIAWLVVLRGAPLELGTTLRTLTLTHDLQWGWGVPLEQGWSIRVESLGYLFLPLLGAIWWTAGRLLGRRGVVGALLLTAAAAVAWALTQSSSFNGPSTELWLFVPGLTAALVESHEPLRTWIARRSRVLVLGLAAVGVLVLFGGLPAGFAVGRQLLAAGWSPIDAGRAQLVTQMAMQGLGATGVMLGLLGREWQGAGPPIGLAATPLRWLGGRSYSFYLLHYAVIGALLPHVLPGHKGLLGFAGLAVAALAVTLVLAVVLFRVVELPGMLLAARLTGSSPPGPLTIDPRWRGRARRAGAPIPPPTPGPAPVEPPAPVPR